ncbi:cathepsin L1 [Aplysia californica]|uniref:Cathepsin L1 n=1 Tax=Aplysia californica TaxID=6500 RepID=A0ABM0K1W3_APLCA|nr:cathepsin L1 [Aplysia californica]
MYEIFFSTLLPTAHSMIVGNACIYLHTRVNGSSINLSRQSTRNDVYPSDEESVIDLFNKFKLDFSKTYHSFQEEKVRFLNFRENVHMINTKNKIHAGITTFRINQFSDMSHTEFREKILMTSTVSPDFEKRQSHLAEFSTDLEELVAPHHFDFTGTGAVTSVKNQGSAGTCWAFATVGNLEGQYFMKTKENATSLSVEQLSDCSSFYDKKMKHPTCGMHGGWPNAAYQYVKQAGGINTDSDYPYCIGKQSGCTPCAPPRYNATVCGSGWPYPPGTCNKSQSCSVKINPKKFVADIKVKGYLYVPKDEETIARFLIKNGPLALVLDATDLGEYSSGVLKPEHCKPEHFNHCVLLVGYGQDKKSGLDYWKIKNSWGTRWGEKGFLRLQRGVGACGVNLMVSTAILK